MRIQEKGVASPRQNSKIAYSCGATNGMRILGGINIGGSSDKENVDDGGAGLFGSLIKWDSRFSKSPDISDYKYVDDKYLKQKGIDPHALKDEIIGGKKAQGSRFDIYMHKDTGELFIFRKGGVGRGIATNEFIK